MKRYNKPSMSIIDVKIEQILQSASGVAGKGLNDYNGKPQFAPSYYYPFDDEDDF